MFGYRVPRVYSPSHITDAKPPPPYHVSSWPDDECDMPRDETREAIFFFFFVPTAAAIRFAHAGRHWWPGHEPVVGVRCTRRPTRACAALGGTRIGIGHIATSRAISNVPRHHRGPTRPAEDSSTHGGHLGIMIRPRSELAVSFPFHRISPRDRCSLRRRSWRVPCLVDNPKKQRYSVD